MRCSAVLIQTLSVSFDFSLPLLKTFLLGSESFCSLCAQNTTLKRLAMFSTGREQYLFQLEQIAFGFNEPLLTLCM